MSKPIALVGHVYICPKVDPRPKPQVGGPVIDAGAKLCANSNHNRSDLYPSGARYYITHKNA